MTSSSNSSLNLWPAKEFRTGNIDLNGSLIFFFDELPDSLVFVNSKKKKKKLNMYM